MNHDLITSSGMVFKYSLLYPTVSYIGTSTVQYSACPLLSIHLFMQLLIFAVQFVYHSKCLQELSEVYTAILIKVNTPGQVINGTVVDGNPQVSAKKTPSLTKLLNGNQTYRLKQTSLTYKSVLAYLKHYLEKYFWLFIYLNDLCL